MRCRQMGGKTVPRAATAEVITTNTSTISTTARRTRKNQSRRAVDTGKGVQVGAKVGVEAGTGDKFKMYICDACLQQNLLIFFIMHFRSRHHESSSSSKGYRRDDSKSNKGRNSHDDRVQRSSHSSRNYNESEQGKINFDSIYKYKGSPMAR